MYVYAIFRYVVAEVIFFSGDDSGLHTSSRQPDTEAPWMVVSAKIGFRQLTLTEAGATKLPTCPPAGHAAFGP
jgi:hypothetical protein